MELYDLNILKRDKKQGDLYDLTNPTFKVNGNFTLKQYVVEQYEEMRLDLVSVKVMGSQDYIDFLLDLNRIDNPLNIKQGDVILYVDPSVVENFRIKPETEDIKKKLFDANKISQTDKSRKEYIENDYSLPPTIMNSPVPSLKYSNNKITIGINENKTF